MADDNTQAANADNQNLPEGAEPDTNPAGNTATDTSTLEPAGQLSEDEVAGAKKDGTKEAIKNSAALAPDIDALANPAEAFKWHGHDEIQEFAFYLDGSLDAMKAARKGGAIADNKLYGLLALERNGQNRTPYVKYMAKELGLKTGEIPGGGPAYTNDTTSITDL